MKIGTRIQSIQRLLDAKLPGAKVISHKITGKRQLLLDVERSGALATVTFLAEATSPRNDLNNISLVRRQLGA